MTSQYDVLHDFTAADCAVVADCTHRWNTVVVSPLAVAFHYWSDVRSFWALLLGIHVHDDPSGKQDWLRAAVVGLEVNLQQLMSLRMFRG